MLSGFRDWLLMSLHSRTSEQNKIKIEIKRRKKRKKKMGKKKKWGKKRRKQKENTRKEQ